MVYQIAPRIVVDSEIRFGKPVIEGTRVPAHVLVAKVGGGMSLEEVASEYGVTLEDVQAALSFAAQTLERQEFRAFA
jgi:uncharacterized protein (DUF433 family)